MNTAHPNGLRLVLRTDAPCGQSMDVPVTVTAEGASESRVLRVGEPSFWPVSGVVRIRAGGFGWLPVSRVVDLDETRTSRVVVDVLPRAALFGRVLDALSGDPIESFGIRVESTLEQSDRGTQIYVGSRHALVSPDGSFCRVPLQEALSHRLTIDAEGYEEHCTGWIPVVPGSPLDAGDILLVPVVTRRLDLLVVDAATGTPLADSAVLVATKPFESKDLVLAGDRISPGPSLGLGRSESWSARTDTEGGARMTVPAGKPLWVAAWRSPYRLEVLEPSSLAVGAEAPPELLAIGLSRGARIEGTLYLGPDLRAVVRRIDVEFQGNGARRRVAVELAAPLDAVPFEMDGLTPGPGELWVVAREEGRGPRLTRALIATQAIRLTESETSYVQIDCGVAFGRGVVRGRVALPAGIDLASLRAFASTDRSVQVARRTVPVRAGRFVLSGCDATRTVIGVEGSDDSGAVLLRWTGEVDGTSNPDVFVDLSRTVVRGHLGDISFLPMEEVVIAPIGDHPLSGIALAEVTAYPGADGEFTVYGLPQGPYRAVGVNSGLRAEFQVVGETVDVYFARVPPKDE